jgi:hypothetical protein
MLTSGSAKYSTAKLPAGSNTITAVYLGDLNNNGSTSTPVSQFVFEATTTTLTSPPNPSAFGQAVTFTAAVSSGIGAPPDGETVMFKRGATVLGTGTLAGGTASLSISTLGAGTKAVTAVYGGDTSFAASTSKAVSQVINKVTTSVGPYRSENHPRPAKGNSQILASGTLLRLRQQVGLATGKVHRNGVVLLNNLPLPVRLA